MYGIKAPFRYRYSRTPLQDAEELRGQRDRYECAFLILVLIRTSTHSKILSNYIVKRGSESLQGRTVLELGSGTGMVGLVAGKLGAKAWITDQA
jgi:hypothetical protein